MTSCTYTQHSLANPVSAEAQAEGYGKRKFAQHIFHETQKAIRPFLGTQL